MLGDWGGGSWLTFSWLGLHFSPNAPSCPRYSMNEGHARGTSKAHAAPKRPAGAEQTRPLPAFSLRIPTTATEPARRHGLGHGTGAADTTPARPRRAVGRRASTSLANSEGAKGKRGRGAGRPAGAAPPVRLGARGSPHSATRTRRTLESANLSHAATNPRAGDARRTADRESRATRLSEHSDPPRGPSGPHAGPPARGIERRRGPGAAGGEGGRGRLPRSLPPPCRG